MSETQAAPSTDDSTDTDNAATLEHVGFELEYPACRGDWLGQQANRSSGSLNRAYDDAETRAEYGSDWPVEGVPPEARGAAGTDHCGAEIRSGVMKLHSDQPETWYEESIRLGEEAGYNFAATGYGRSYFGLHTHLSPIPEEKLEAIGDVTESEEWPLVFFCSSINQESLDPWRHYSSSSPSSPYISNRRGQETDDDDHYEFRLQEPVLPEHFGLVCNFWREVDVEGPEVALENAQELVFERDERLTSIARYHALDERVDEFPNEGVVFAQDSQTDESTARWFADLME